MIVCECHAEPMYRERDTTHRGGFRWRCAVKKRRYEAARYDVDRRRADKQAWHERVWGDLETRAPRQLAKRHTEATRRAAKRERTEHRPELTRTLRRLYGPLPHEG